MGKRNSVFIDALLKTHALITIARSHLFKQINNPFMAARNICFVPKSSLMLSPHFKAHVVARTQKPLIPAHCQHSATFSARNDRHCQYIFINTPLSLHFCYLHHLARYALSAKKSEKKRKAILSITRK